jgi:putative transposase
MIRTQEIRLYPTKAQAETLRYWMRLACRVYNCALELKRLMWNTAGVSLTLYDLSAQLTDLRQSDGEYGAVPVQVHRDALRKLDRAYSAFFRRVSNRHAAGTALKS